MCIRDRPGFKGKEFYWHSDFETWHVEDGMPSMRALSCSVLLTENNDCNGPLMLVPGSHRQFISCVGETPNDHYKQSLKKQEYGVPDPVSLQLLVEQGGIRTMTAKAGSVVFFDCNTCLLYTSRCHVAGGFPGERRRYDMSELLHDSKIKQLFFNSI